MAEFPEAEAQIAALAALVAEGLGQAPEDFPTPPVPASELKAKLEGAGETQPTRLGAAPVRVRADPYYD